MLFQNGQLVEGGAVEDHVGILLEGENPFFLAATHRIPHGQGFLHRGATGFVIAYRAAEQAEVATADAVVVVQAQGDQGCHVHTEDQMGLQILGEQDGVEAVDTLHDDDGGLGQLELSLTVTSTMSRVPTSPAS